MKRSALGGFLWLSMGNGVRAGLKITVLAVLGRLLTPRDFGVVAAAGVVLWFSFIFSSLGVGPALVQRRTLDPAHVSTGFVFSVAFGIVTGALIWLLAPWLAALLRIEGLAPVLRGFAVVFPIAGVSLVAEALLQRELRFGSIAGAELLSYATGYGVVGIALAWSGFGVWSLVGAEIVKTTLKSGLMLAAMPHARRVGFDVGALRELVYFGSGFTAKSISTYLAYQGDNFVVARVLGAAALGLYSRAYDLMLVPAQALGTVLEKVLFPTMAKVQDDPARLRLAYRRSTALVALVVLPMSAATVVLAPEIILTLLGDQWGGAVLPLRILATAMYFRVAYMIGHSVATSTGAVHRAAWRNFLFAALVVLGAAIGQRWGLPGVAAGVTVAVVVNFAMTYQLGRQITGLPVADFVALHLPAVSLAIVLGAEAWALAAAMRGAGTAAPLTLIVTAAAMSVTALLLLRLVPRSILGEDGIWMIDLVCGSAPARVRPLLRRALCAQP